MSSQNPASSRPIGPQGESFFSCGMDCSGGKLDVMCCMLTARVPGLSEPLTQESVAEVYHRVSMRQPLLRSRVVDTSDGRMVFESSETNAAENSKLISPLCTESELERLWRLEIDVGFLLADPMRWRLFVFSEPSDHGLIQIIMSCDHTLSDGISCVTMLQQVIGLLSEGGVEVQASGDCKRQRTDQRPPPLPMLPSSTVLMSSAPEASGATHKLSNSVVPTAAPFHFVPSTASMTDAGDSCTQCTALRVFGATELSALAVACRGERTSVTAALAASVLTALAETITDAHGGWVPLGRAQQQSAAGRPVLCAVPVSLRKYYEPPISNEHVGFHIGMVKTFFDLDCAAGGGGDKTLGLWKAARAWKEQLDARMAAGEHLELATAPAPSLDDMRSMLKSAASSCSGRTKTLTLTNRGAFELPCELLSFRHTNNIVLAGPAFQLNAVAFNGVMYTTLTYLDRVIPPALGQAVADAMLANLQAMAARSKV